MISHVRQGEVGCALATVAMLNGGTYRETELLFVDYAKTEHDIKVDGYTQAWYRSIDNQLVQVCILKFLAIMLPGFTERDIPTSYHSYGIDLSGRGWVGIQWTDGTSHAMAFEDGVVYDPNANCGLSWNDWWLFELPNYGPGFGYVTVMREGGDGKA